MAITQVTDHVAQAVAAMVEQYKNKPKFVGLLTAFVNQVQKAENGLFPLLALPDLGPVNLCPNPSFESDANSDGFADHWAVYNWSADPGVVGSLVPGLFGNFAQRISWSVANTGAKGVQLLGGAVDGIDGGWKPLKSYVLSVSARASGGGIGSGVVWNWNTQPSSFVDLLNPPLTSSFQQYARRITWGSAVEVAPVGGLYLSIAGTGQANAFIEFDGALVTEGTTLLDYQTTGANLDLLGRIVGEDRNGRTDLSYRTAIQAKILLNLSSGTIEEIYAIFALLLSVNGVSATMQIAEHFPKALTLRLQGASVTDAVASDLATVLKKAKDAGARAFLDYGNTTPLFGLDGNGAGLDTGYLGGSL